MLAGQQPSRVAWVCVQLARSRRVECGRTAAAGCSQFGLAEMQRVARWCWVGWALPDGAKAQPQGSGAQAFDECSPKASSALLLMQKGGIVVAWIWLVAAPRRPAPAADSY